MQQWEYLTTFLQADAKSKTEELKRRFPGLKTFFDYSPLSLLPQLDEWGKEGWEPVSIEPVFPGERGDVMVNAAGGVAHRGWTHTYFCAFKRPKREPSAGG